MTGWTLLKRGFRFHARAHLAVVIGAAVGASTLVGALVVGDSMRASLLRKSLEAIGPFESALVTGDRFFTTGLVTSFTAVLGGSNPPGGPLREKRAVALLTLPAVGIGNDGESRANRAFAIGCDREFLRLLSGNRVPLQPGEALLNPALAAQLGVQPGDELLMRVPKPGALSREVTLTERDETSTTLRLKIAGVLPPSQGGDFSLVRSQVSPLNVFLDREELGQAIAMSGKANVLMVSGESRPRELEAALKQSWSFADLALELRRLTNTSEVELRSSRVFLDPPIVRAAQGVSPANAPRPVLTYLANLIEAGTNGTPYSFVTAAGPPLVPEAMRADEILVTQWLAEDLDLKPGDKVSVSYFLPESGANLQEATNLFTVRAVVPTELPWEDRTLMPDFPGIEKAESTGDWEVGFELVHKIRPKDEDYWKQRRGTPKAFVTYEAGRRMWANRFGEITALRWPANADAKEPLQDLERAVSAGLTPAQLGLQFDPIREQAIAGANNSQDFGQLFLGFSMFLLFSALLLVSLLFQFGLERRASEVGILLGVGFLPGQVKRLLLSEGVALAVAGGLLGIGGGIAYAKMMLWGLGTLWRDAVGTAGLHFHASGANLAIGFAASVFAAALTIYLTLRKLTRQPILSLLGQAGEPPAAAPDARLRGRIPWLPLAALVGALGLLGWTIARGDSANPGAFFGAGALLLVAGFASVGRWLRLLGRHASVRHISLRSIGIRGSARRRKRSLGTVALLGCGVFLVVSVSAFRLDAERAAEKHSSGTGGFEFIGESTMSVVQDLNAESGQEFFGLSAEDLKGVQIVAMRLRSGDDASCLNLNRAQRPRVLGVRPEALAGRFTFSRMAKEVGTGWESLSRRPGFPEDEVPAIGDAASIQWALGKKVGETIDYVDESGRPFKLRLVGAIAGSVLQGNLLIDEAEFRKRFPGESGSRFFLVDAPASTATNVQARLTRALEDAGLELVPAFRRLAEFNAVQNTYLGAFQVLGGLGLLLGSVGLGIVVMRNVMERRGELGLLAAVGFRHETLQRLVLLEHGALLGLGIGIGLAAGMIAVLPALLTPGTPLPLFSLGLVLAAVLLNGLIWTWGATFLALRGNLLESLRNE